MARKRLIYSVSCYVLAALFLFSGFAKGVNPFGLSVQFGDYFAAMGLSFLTPMSGIFAVMLPTFEMVLGVLLLAGLYRKLTAWLTMIVMLFFTLLTLWIAVYNPVSDCGCFGDLLVISNWETFIKNLVFMIPTLTVFVGRNKFSEKKNWRALLVAIMLCGLFPLYSFNNLPIIDVTPYKLGVNIWDAMHDGELGTSHTTLIYKNRESGKKVEFEIEDTEWQDDTKWEFVESKTTELAGGRAPSILNLPMIDHDGSDHAEEILNVDGEVVIIVSPRPSHQSKEILEVISKAHDEGTSRIILLHSSVSKLLLGDDVEVYTTDNSVLKTMIQHHSGGVLHLTDGVITAKEIL